MIQSRTHAHSVLNKVLFAYLEKLGFSELPAANLATLTTLQENHIHSFTHDTIDSYFKRPVSLDPTVIIEKFLREQRGGLCFELNSAFCHLLQQLGFDAKLMPSNVKHVETREYNLDIETHAVIIVNLNDVLYLVDVGFADSFRTPIKIENGELSGIHGHYRASHIEKNIYGLYKYLNDNWMMQYNFTLSPRASHEFQANLDFVCHSPKHEFSHSLICTRSTPSGHIVLLRLTHQDNKISIRDGTKKISSQFSDLAEAKEILVNQFGMSREVILPLQEAAITYVLEKHVPCWLE